jgi:hypothetical protein
MLSVNRMPPKEALSVSDLEDRSDVAIQCGPESPPKPKAIRPVHFWSSVGALCVIVAGYAYLSWILSGSATPVDPGPDPIRSEQPATRRTLRE